MTIFVTQKTELCYFAQKLPENHREIQNDINHPTP